MPSLGELISARRAAEGWTYDRLAEKSGHALSKQRWQQLGTDTRVNEFPEPRTLQLIADAMDVGVDRVILATAVTLGVTIPDTRSRFANMLPPNADMLTDDQRDAVFAVIRAMRPRVADHDLDTPVTDIASRRAVDQPTPEVEEAARDADDPSRGQQFREARDRVDEAAHPPAPDPDHQDEQD